jgi:hypothetical protein
MIGRRSHDAAQSFEAALGGATPRDDDVARLVRLAEGICEAAVAEPDPAFRGALRERLMSEAVTVLVPVSAAPRRPETRTAMEPRRRRHLSLVAATIAATGVVGLVGSSASAVPGELLYPVKRSVESVEMQLHRGDTSRGSFQLHLAAERLAEARTLSADDGSAELIADTLDDFSATAADGSTTLFTAYDATGQEQAIRTVNDFAAESSADLAALSPQLPDDVAPSYEAARDAVTDLAAQAAALCGSCAPADVGALVQAVDDLAGKTPVAKPTTATEAPPQQPEEDPAAPRATTGSPVPAGGSTPRPTAAPTKAPATSIPAVPAPALPTRTPALTDLTDPLVGGLLGDDTQPGLVPGLVNGLLGTSPAPK